MHRSTTAKRLRRAGIVLLALAALLAAAGLWWKPRAEARLRAGLVREAERHGWLATFEDVRVGLLYPVTVRGARLQRPGMAVVDVESVKVPLRPGLLLGRARLELGRVRASLPNELALEVVPTLWEVPLRPARGGLVELLEEGARLEVEWQAQASTGGLLGQARLDQAPLGRLVTLTRGGQALLDAGVVTGQVKGRRAGMGGVLDLNLQVSATGLRAASLSARESPSGAPPLGPPLALALEIEGSWRPETDSLELKRWTARTDGLALSGDLTLADVRAAPRLGLHLDVAQLDFARVLSSAGLEAPQALAAAGSDLGAASLELRAAGLLSDPASFQVTQKIDFRPPARRLAALERLRGDFVHEQVGRDGARVSILVTPGAPDFVPLHEVPPLFVRTLLLGEDAGFWGHRGIDLAELPSAVLTNLARGKPARGASTITQQLAKNLFLSRDKAMGRKLQELCLALLIESTLDKQRILEIYLNVIEWGPRLYGLRPAARRYFAREPAQLTPAQMAFLVALIPGPVKYQPAFAHGRPSGGFRPMMDTLLARLRSVEALDEQQYQAALAEDVVVVSAQPAGPPGDALAGP